MSFLRVLSQDKSAYPITMETHLRVSQKHVTLSHLYGNDAEPVRVDPGENGCGSVVRTCDRDNSHHYMLCHCL
ncbi:hypothetical protein RJT34_15399 [Clitoria ternatea]|uniref:Uncharacterized protein n=1 Tax=Clitoria ternatea TaxID=43366 RepID=A0AAN9PBD7_CLITE